jgi:hypothetical protein
LNSASGEEKWTNNSVTFKVQDVAVEAWNMEFYGAKEQNFTLGGIKQETGSINLAAPPTPNPEKANSKKKTKISLLIWFWSGKGSAD